MDDIDITTAILVNQDICAALHFRRFKQKQLIVTFLVSRSHFANSNTVDEWIGPRRGTIGAPHFTPVDYSS